MKKSLAKTHLFKDCSHIFEDLLESFNEKYSKSLVVKGSGVSKSLESIQLDFLKYDSINPLKLFYCKKLTRELKDHIIDIKCLTDERLVYDCKIYFIPSNKMKGFYMIQKNFFPITPKFKFHIWSLDDRRILDFDKHWL
tara:strand:+ start:17354 stop:17770 length:417 start_codon:yes stop_codon:yes gene_type:complete